VKNQNTDRTYYDVKKNPTLPALKLIPSVPLVEEEVIPLPKPRVLVPLKTSKVENSLSFFSQQLLDKVTNASKIELVTNLELYKNNILMIRDFYERNVLYNHWIERLSHFGDYSHTSQIIKDISLLSRTILKPHIMQHAELFKVSREAKEWANCHFWKKGLPIEPSGVSESSFHNIYIINSKIVFKIGEGVAAIDKAMYDLSLLMGMEGVVPATKVGTMKSLRLNCHETIHAGKNILREYPKGSSLKDVKGMVQVFKNNCYYGPHNTFIGRWSSSDKNLFYSKIDPFYFCQATIFSLLISHGDLRINTLKDSNILFQSIQGNFNRLRPIVIDMEISMPENNKESTFRKQIFGISGITPYRSSLLGFSLSDMRINGTLLNKIKEMVFSLNEEQLISFLQKIKFSYKGVNSNFNKKNTTQNLYNTNQVEAFKERLQRLKTFISRSINFSLRELVYAVFPCYEHLDKLLIQKGYSAEKRCLMIGLLPSSRLKRC
jgi:hypothetical protein